MSSLLASFVLIFGVACLIAYHAYKNAIHYTIHSNKARANLLAEIILEHQRAAIAVVRSYANRPLVIHSTEKNDPEEAVQHLDNLKKNNPEIESAFISNPDGTAWAILPMDKQSLNKNLFHQDWYKGVTKDWEAYVSNVYKMMNKDGDLVVTICAPVHDGKGKIIGILAATQSTCFFNDMIKELGLNFDEMITLIDQQGHIIFSNRFPCKKEIMAYPSFEFVEKVMKGEKGDVAIRDFSDGNKAKYVSFAPVQGIGWSVIVEEARSEVLQSISSYLILISAVSLLMFMIVVLSLMYLRGRHQQMTTLKESENRLRVLATQLLTAQESERRLIANELHDSIGSALSAVKFKVEDTLQQMERGITTSESLKGLISTVQQTLEESRRIQTQLRPSLLDDLGILSTLDWHCREFQKTFSHIHIDKEIDILEEDMPNSLKIVIYRICQEALNNIAKHSKANLVTLSLRKINGLIELNLQDNGQGFNVERIFSIESYKKGLGLGSMRERAELSGGIFSIESVSGKGTIIRASWPL